MLVVLTVTAVVGLAALDALKAGEKPEEPAALPRLDRLRGPDMPPPAALPGRLVFATLPGCRLQVLDLATLELGSAGPPTACRLWSAPSGEWAVAARKDVQTGAANDLWLVRLDGDEPAMERRLGLARSQPTWSHDGALVAWCGLDGQTIVARVSSPERRLVPGCFPLFQADGSIVTRTSERDILVDGRFLADADPILGERLIGQGAGRDGFALAVQEPLHGLEAATKLELWTRGGRERTVRLPVLYGPAGGFFGLRIEISPSGEEAAFIAPESLAVGRTDDLAALVDLAGGRLSDPVTAPSFAGMAWSPDGTWLALATRESVLVFGTPRVDPVYLLPVTAGAVAWVRPRSP